MARQTSVEVTQADIDGAARKNSSRCVVATAIARAWPDARRVMVDIHSIKFSIGERRYTYLVPPAVQEYIVAFDAGDTLHPFTFRLREDQRMVVRTERRTERGKRLKNAYNTEVRQRRRVAKVEADPEATPAQRKAAREKLAAATLAHQVAKDGHAANPKPIAHRDPMPTDVPPSQVQPKPRKQAGVFRRAERSYGRRVLRVNNDPGPGDFRGPLDE